uniref:Death domain-containing protein n=1 Tax=Ciona savignyi TaxID=51511 RepID=H2YKZ2_CIOSA
MPSDYDKQEQKHQAIASQLGIQWPQLAGALGLNADDVWKIQKQSDGGNPGEQSSAML